MAETPRARRRQETIARIKELALHQLATDGPSGLSLRAVARDLGVVSSAVYRYYPSQDALVTDLLLDAYGDLAAALAGVEAPDPRAVCHRLRDWAVAEPHRFALLYGTPIPGYRAPQATVPAAAAVFETFARGLDGAVPAAPPPADGPLADQIGRMQGWAHPPLPDETLLLAATLLGVVVGVVTLELNGQLVGSFEPAEPLLDHLVSGALAPAC